MGIIVRTRTKLETDPSIEEKPGPSVSRSFLENPTDVASSHFSSLVSADYGSDTDGSEWFFHWFFQIVMWTFIRFFYWWSKTWSRCFSKSPAVHYPPFIAYSPENKSFLTLPLYSPLPGRNTLTKWLALLSGRKFCTFCTTTTLSRTILSSRNFAQSSCEVLFRHLYHLEILSYPLQSYETSGLLFNLRDSEV